MRLNIYLVINQLLILGSNYYFVCAMTGPSVRNALNIEFRFAVSILKVVYISPDNVQESHICSGSLLTRKDVATAASCIRDQAQNEIRVSVGSNDFRLGTKHYVDWWLTFDDWAVFNGVPMAYDENDVANIRLMTEVLNTIPRIALSKTVNYRLYGHEADMVGWTAYNATSACPYLRAATVIIMKNRDCIREVSRLAQTTTRLDKREALCTKAQPYAVMGPGDIGGPLVHRNKLAGINRGTVPNTIPSGDPRSVNMHVNVEYYKDFFNANIDADADY